MTSPDLPPLPQRELDALLDHIYEYGTTSEGVSRLVRAVQLAAYRAGMEQAAKLPDNIAPEHAEELDRISREAADMFRRNERDAARYRFIRQYGYGVYLDVFNDDVPSLGSVEDNALRLDAEIDAAIRRAAEEKP